MLPSISLLPRFSFGFSKQVVVISWRKIHIQHAVAVFGPKGRFLTKYHSNLVIHTLHKYSFFKIIYSYLFYLKLFNMYFILDGNDLNVIMEALVDIMRTTCIKFVPHSNEPDYIVFVEYKDPNQKTGFIILLLFL